MPDDRSTIDTMRMRLDEKNITENEISQVVTNENDRFARTTSDKTESPTWGNRTMQPTQPSDIARRRAGNSSATNSSTSPTTRPTMGGLNNLDANVNSDDPAITPNRPDPEANDPVLTTSANGAGGITRVLRRAILNREYMYNDQLPAERALAAEFRASRGTVREALRRLEEIGLVLRRPGSGTYVRYRPPVGGDDVAVMTSPIELLEVRLAVEPNITRLAVSNATTKDLQRLEQTLVSLEASGSDPSAFSKHDEEFHLEVAECTRNPLMISIYRQINDVREHAQWDARKDKILTPERIAAYNRQHRALFDMLVRRDATAAVEMITDHLLSARSDMLGSMNGAGVPQAVGSKGT